MSASQELSASRFFRLMQGIDLSEYDHVTPNSIPDSPRYVVIPSSRGYLGRRTRALRKERCSK